MKNNNLLIERFQQLAGIKPLYQLNEGQQNANEIMAGDYGMSDKAAQRDNRKLLARIAKRKAKDSSSLKDIGDGIKENEGQGKYNKTLEVIKSFEDSKVLQDFLKTFPKGKDVSKADYFTFVEKYYNEGQDDYYNEANWKYILSGDMSVFDDIAEGGEVDESYTQYAAIIRDLYPGKSWEELTSSEQFEVRSTYEDFN